LEVNKGRNFKPGHDQRLRGVLLRAWDGGDDSVAEQLTQKLGWYSVAELAERRAGAEQKAAAKAEREAAKVAKAQAEKQAK
jgi:hypothetical protein